jgi:hypothetical protein
MISIFVSSIYFFWMRKQLLRSIDKLDIENLTPSDYCLQGYYMEFEDYKPAAMEEEIRKYFNEEYNGMGDKIEYVNPAYDIGSYYELSEKMRMLSKEMQMVEQYMTTNNLNPSKYSDMMATAQHDNDFPKKKSGFCGSAPIDF